MSRAEVVERLFSRRAGAVRLRRPSFRRKRVPSSQPKSIADKPWLDPDGSRKYSSKASTDLRRVRAVDGVSLRIYKGEMLRLVGARAAVRPRCCACWPVSRLPRRRIMIDDQDMTAVPPHERPVT